MPKKFAGENSKAVAARQRKEDAKQEKESKLKKMVEDAEWEDNDEKLKKKQQKKVGVLFFKRLHTHLRLVIVTFPFFHIFKLLQFCLKIVKSRAG